MSEAPHFYSSFPELSKETLQMMEDMDKIDQKEKKDMGLVEHGLRPGPGMLKLEEEGRCELYHYDYPMPSLVVDIVVTAAEGSLLLLVERKKDPWKGQLALPGGFVNIDEPIDEAAIRELREETGIKAKSLTFVGWYDEPNRDPRGRIVSMAFHVDCGNIIPAVEGMDDVKNAQWISKEGYSLSVLAADHAKIIGDAIGWGYLRSDRPRVTHANITTGGLPRC
jgi:ADP-ribose pyrophosphatase YjhB (NUDIX family)